MTMELHATPEEVMRAVETLEKFAREQQLPDKLICGLTLALEECGSNIVNHALHRDAGQKFRVTFERQGSQMLIELRDHGPEFDPTTAQERTPSAEDDDIPGGWGIHLVRRYIDDIRYQRESGENILRLTKRLDDAPGSDSKLHPEPEDSEKHT
jgi:serine/threonine-protein kinase RsbW